MNTDSQEESEMESGKEGTTMTKTMKIEGMMCGHCEARVKKVLEALAEVDSAEVSHEAGTAVVTLNSDVQDEVLKKTVGGSGLQSNLDPVVWMLSVRRNTSW